MRKYWLCSIWIGSNEERLEIFRIVVGRKREGKLNIVSHLQWTHPPRCDQMKKCPIRDIYYSQTAVLISELGTYYSQTEVLISEMGTCDNRRDTVTIFN